VRIVQVFYRTIVRIVCHLARELGIFFDGSDTVEIFFPVSIAIWAAMPHTCNMHPLGCHYWEVDS